MWVSKKVSFHALFTLFLLLGVGIVLTVFSQKLGEGVRQGLSLCGELVIPSLFVFLCFCEWACGSGKIQRVSSVLQRLFRFLFGKGFCGSTPLLLCLIGGYPMGASALAVLHQKQMMGKDLVKRLSLWIFCPSPAFVITGVGQGMLGSLKAGVVLWCGCVVSCLLTGMVICRFPMGLHNDSCRTFFNTEAQSPLVNAVGSATEKMLVICGTVILVGGILSLVNGLPIPYQMKQGFHLFLEVTNGCSYLSAKGGSLAELGSVLMFGGIGTHLQCKMLLGGNFPPYKVYVTVRICQTVITYLLITLFCFCFPQVAQTLSLGITPTVGTVSVLPSVGLLATCFVFLCSLHQKPIFRRNHCEKSGICS